jgi:hypothetical protein
MARIKADAPGTTVIPVTAITVHRMTRRSSAAGRHDTQAAIAWGQGTERCSFVIALLGDG